MLVVVSLVRSMSVTVVKVVDMLVVLHRWVAAVGAVLVFVPLGLEVRIGLHTGECERIGGDVGGMAVHMAARVGAMAQTGEILVSGTTYGTVVGSGLTFADHGKHALKGVPGVWPIFRLLR